nr:neutral zinc metallopeptidase [Microlunatus antarcticus]
MRTDGTTPTAASPAATRSAAPRAVPAPGSPTPTPTATPTPTPAVTPASTTSPTAAPQAPLPTAPTQPAPAPGPDRSLKTNALYGVDLGKASVSCDLKVRRPKPPLADKKLQPYLTDVVDCLTKVFEGPLAAQGFTLEQPKVQTYHKRVETPCGDFGQSGSPAYYCSGTRTIYWPDTVDDGREAYTFARLGYVGLVAHEFGHHLQKTTGMLDAYAMAHEKATSKGGSKKEGYALSRRLELQAQCFEGVFLHATAKDLDVSSKDRRELKAWHSYTGDEDPPDDRKPDHGSSKSQFGWLDRGLDSGDFADCNTWTASASKVG